MNRPAWLVGVLVQGLVLGTLLALALSKIPALANGARIFRYQGF